MTLHARFAVNFARWRRIAAVLTCLFVASGPALASDAFPNHPVRLVVPFAPGGAVDILGRLIAKYLSDELGQQVFVDNRGGAGGSIGSAFVANSRPDGYTLILHTVSSAVINGLVNKHLPYDLPHAFSPVAEVAESPTLLVISKKVPAKTLQQFIALAKNNPGKFKFGSTGVGSSVQMEAVLFESLTGTKLVHIPFRGGGPAVKDLVAGETQMEVGSVGVFLPFIKAGQLRPLCVNGKERIKILPDVPTSAEAGLANFVLPDWYGLFAPKGTPPEVIDRLYQAISKILANPDMQQRMARFGLSPAEKTPAELEKFWRHEFTFWAPIVKKSGVVL